jgi:hypothetical protein
VGIRVTQRSASHGVPRLTIGPPPSGCEPGPIFALPMAGFPFTLGRTGFRRVANRLRPVLFLVVDLGHAQGHRSGPRILL